MRLIPKSILTVMALGAGLTAQADYSSTVLSFNPAGYWRLNETAPVPVPQWATNSGTAGITAYGTYQSGAFHPAKPGALVAEPNNGAASFTNNRVSIPNNQALNPNGPFTTEFWAYKIPGTGYPLGVVASLSSTVNRQGWVFYDMGPDWAFRMGNSSGYIAAPEGGTAAVGQWYHLAGVYDGTHAILYVNGVAVSTNNVSGPYEPNPDYPTQIGTVANSAFTHDFAGSIDEVVIYTNALTAEEILAHYANGTNAAPTTPYEQLVLAQHPVAYYRLDEPSYTAPDPSTFPMTADSGSVGNLADGTNFPGVIAGVAAAPYNGFGAGNWACGFDGGNGYIGLGNPDGLNFDGNITMMAWIKPQTTGGLQNILAHGYITSPNAEVSLRVNTGQYQLGSWDATTSTAGASYPMPAADIGRWTFLAGTYDGTQWNLYWNGSLVATQSAFYGSLSMAADWAIGARGGGTERFFNGTIDEVAIFTTALTPAQIQQVYYAADVPPFISQQPQAPVGTVYEGSSVTLSAVAGGNPTLAYQWTKNGINLNGKTTSVLALSNVVTNDGGNYALVVTNNYGAVTSSVVALTVVSGPPLIVQQPLPAARYAGAAATFSVTVGGSVPYSYQWMFNVTNVIGGATASSYTVSPVQPGSAGTYNCVISNPYGSTNTVAVPLTVLPAPSGYAAVVLADNPIAYWRLGETNGILAGDYWGGHNGTYHGATLGQPGFSLLDTNTAATFGPGINSYVGNIQGINFAGPGSSATFSVEFWAKGLPSQQLNDGGFIAKGPGGSEQFAIDGYGNHYRFYGSGAGAAQSTTLEDGTWQHVVGVCDGPSQQWSIYVNGQYEASGTVPTTILDSTNGVSLAARQLSVGGDYNYCWNALLDEVAIYDKALTPEQVLAHYNARYGTTTPPLIRQAPVPTTNYVGLAATLSVVAEGSDYLSYQWQQGTTDLPGENNPTLTISPLDLTTSPGTYRVVISNGEGTTNVATTLTVLPAPTSLNLSENLVLHLQFDGNYLDSSGRGNNAVPRGNPIFVPGQIGSQAVSVQVDATDHIFDYVSVTNSPDLQFGANDSFTLAFWVNYSNWGNDDTMLGNAIGSTYQVGYVICNWTGNIEVSLVSTVNSGTYLRSPVPPGTPRTGDGAWHNVVLVVDRGVQQASTYVDGGLLSSWDIGSMGSMYYGNPLTIGNDPTGTYGAGGPGAGGLIDDVGAWRRALSPLEVASIYVGGISNSISFAQPVTTVTLTVQRSGSQIQLSWPAGTLQSADQVTGPYTNVTPQPASPYLVTPSLSKQFYRVH